MIGWPSRYSLAVARSGALALLCLIPLPALAGAFLQSPGAGEVIVSARFERSDRFFDSSGKLVPVRDYRKFEMQAWMEYGLYESLTLIFAPSITRLGSSAPPTPVRMETAVFDVHAHVEAGARFRLYRSGDSVVSVQATARLRQPLEGAFARLVRDERNEIDVRLLYGRSFSFGAFSGYADIQSGYRYRAGAGDEWRSDLSLGLNMRPGWMLLLQNFNLVAWRRGAAPAKRSHKLQASLVYSPTPRWAIQAGLFTTLAARNARRDHGMIAAVWRKF